MTGRPGDSTLQPELAMPMRTVLSRAAGGPLVRTACRWRGHLARFPMPVIVLAMRVGMALVFWRSGLAKIAAWEPTLILFAEEYRVPLLPPTLAAWMATALELACPFLLILGIGTRLAALALLFMTAVIQLFVYPELWPDHVLWASILVCLLTRGAGSLSLDAMIARRAFGSPRLTSEGS